MNPQLNEKDVREGIGDLYLEKLMLQKQLEQTQAIIQQLRNENEKLKEENKNSESE